MEKGKETYGRPIERLLYLAMGIMLLAAGFLTVRGTAAFVANGRAEEKRLRVVLDAGHGGSQLREIRRKAAAAHERKRLP